MTFGPAELRSPYRDSFEILGTHRTAFLVSPSHDTQTIECNAYQTSHSVDSLILSPISPQVQNITLNHYQANVYNYFCRRLHYCSGNYSERKGHMGTLS